MAKTPADSPATDDTPKADAASENKVDAEASTGEVGGRTGWLFRKSDSQRVRLGEANPDSFLALGFKFCTEKEAAKHEANRDAELAALQPK